MKAKSVASPVSSGGGGEQFEQHVAGLSLALLLVRGMPPVLTDTSVVEVHLQTGHKGWRTDDLLLVGERSDGSRRRLALQARRRFVVSAGDDNCRKTVLGMWDDFSSDGFEASQDQLAVVTLHGTSTLLGDFVSLLECARASLDANDFRHRLSLDGLLSAKAKDQDRDIRLILTEGATEAPDDDAYWRFLRTVNVLSFDLNTSTSQTEAWVLSLLAACMVDGGGSNEAAQATWEALLACAGKGKPSARSYARGDLPADLRKRHLPVSREDRSGLTALIEHGRTVRDGIRSTLGDGYAIERYGEVQSLARKLAEHQVVIVSGAAGTGKSALARELVAQSEDRYPVLSFLAVEFATAHVDETLANAQTPLNLQRLLALLAGHDRKVVFVDGVERLLERSVRDGFYQLLQLARRDASAQFLLTVRDYSLETVRNALIPADVRPEIFEVPALTDGELDDVGEGVPTLAQPLGKGTLRALLRTPYLLDLASQLTWGEAPLPATMREFRRKVWRELIRAEDRASGGMPRRREEAFLDIAWRRAVELRSFVRSAVGDAEALEALHRDSLVAASRDSSAVYTLSHDVLEDWGVLQRIEDRFAESGGSPTALAEVVGGYPALRRGLRQWLAERFEYRSDEAQSLVLGAIAHDGLPAHFRDDCVVAALLSESAVAFIEACRPRIIGGDLALLDQVTHVLRVACRESPKWLDVPGLPSQLLEPTGAGWASTLRLVLDLLEALLPERAQLVLALVEDWARQIDWRNSSPEGVSDAGVIASRLLREFKDYDFEDARERVLKVVVKIPGAVPLFKDLMERARTCSHEDLTAFGLLDLVLTKPEGGSVCRDYPDEVIALLDARLRLSDTDRKRERAGYGPAMDEVDNGFGVRGLPTASYFPPSALQGPFSALLAHHPRKAVAFILSLLNHVGESYATDRWAEQILEPASKTTLTIPGGGTVEQWSDPRFFALYRGSQVGPDSIVSALMALEFWLLSMGERESVNLEAWLLYVLENSNNVMATAVVASVCVAYPEKAGRAGLALLSSRDVVQLDRGRLALESGSSLEAFFGLDPHHRLYEKERMASNRRTHRREDLQSLAVRMQLGDQREAVWNIIDRHRAELPAEPAEDSRVWRLALHGMDVRGYVPMEEPEGHESGDGEYAGDRVYLRPGKMEADVQKMVDEAASSSGSVGRYLGLQNLAWKLWDGDTSVGEVDWRASLLTEAQAIECELDEAEEYCRDGPGLAAAVCIRDHLEELDDVGFEWCVKRVDIEVRRRSATTDSVDRFGRSLRADRVCASVVPMLASHARTVEGVDARALLALAVTHPINEVSEHAFCGLGAFVGDDHKWLALQCLAGAAYRSRLAEIAWEAARGRRASGTDDRRDPFDSIVPATRETIEDGSLDAEEELRLVDFGSPVAGPAVKAVLAVFEGRPDWDESRGFYERIGRWLLDAWGDDPRGSERPPRNYELESEALRSLARFVIRLPVAEAERICAPIEEAVASQRQGVEHFVSELIVTADGNADDCFWALWQRLADEIARSPWGQGLRDETSFGLGLLRMIFLGPYWKEDAKDWHRLKGHRHRVNNLALNLPATVPVMRAYTDYLDRIGYASLPGSFEVVGRMLGNGDAERIASDSSVAFNLETLLRPFVYSQPHRIKTDPALREAVLVTLDALVAGGSASAYRMRDDFVTPSSG